jgi:hypothetical protein
MPLRMLLVGDSGTGKTGSLLPLLKNYTLRIADFDASSFLPLNATAEQKQNLDIKIFTDKITKTMAGQMIDPPTTVDRFGSALDKWDDKGPVKKWDNKTILVIDSLTFLCRALARQFLQLNKKPIDSTIEARQYGAIQSMITGLMDQLHNDTINCHLIVISHLDYRDFETGTYSSVGMMEQGTGAGQVAPANVSAKGVPTVFGAKLGPQIGRYFDFMIRTKISTLGGMKPRRIIQTTPDAFIDLKCPILSLEQKGELPLSSGLAEIFSEWEKRQ